MDKIWYENPSKSEVIGRCGGDEKTNDHAEPTSRTLKKTHKKQQQKLMCIFDITIKPMIVL